VNIWTILLAVLTTTAFFWFIRWTEKPATKSSEPNRDYDRAFQLTNALSTDDARKRAERLLADPAWYETQRFILAPTLAENIAPELREFLQTYERVSGKRTSLHLKGGMPPPYAQDMGLLALADTHEHCVLVAEGGSEAVFEADETEGNAASRAYVFKSIYHFLVFHQIYREEVSRTT
jgi:hypothetical protein